MKRRFASGKTVMRCRAGAAALVRAAVALGAAALVLSPPVAQASLLGASVDVIGVYGTLAPDNLGTRTVTSAGAFYAATPNTGTDFLVTPTQIVLTNRLSNTAYCTQLNAVPCPDAFDGFRFLFSGSPTPDLIGVTVAAASAADFQPVGLLLASPTEISLNLAGRIPALGNQLVLDLQFPSAPPPIAVPEPAGVALLVTGLLGLAIVRRTAHGARDSSARG